MVERREPPINNGSIPVQQMPDFKAALNTYQAVLVHANVDPESVAKNVNAVVARNKTRQDGNRFINHVNQVSKKILPNESQITATS